MTKFISCIGLSDLTYEVTGPNNFFHSGNGIISPKVSGVYFVKAKNSSGLSSDAVIEVQINVFTPGAEETN
ncbi:MAG: hypothetical protein PHZ25_04300 [Candidatus Pacebacteria bacterium]|nr:hypothetical protein [Candidatus Paceibacterota bacterium]MDD4762212.1 hypothetical protein [Candidatus Paceibacterota bacterium]